MLIIELPLKPISLNSCYVALKNGRRVPSKEYVKFRKEFDSLILPSVEKIKQFFGDFNEQTDEVHATLEYSTPDLYTKKNTISCNSIDVDNCFKNINDLLFKIHAKVDDSAITELHVKKVYNDAHKIKLTYCIHKRI